MKEERNNNIIILDIGSKYCKVVQNKENEASVNLLLPYNPNYLIKGVYYDFSAFQKENVKKGIFFCKHNLTFFLFHCSTNHFWIIS